MKTKVRQSGISLTEMTVVVAAVALLGSLSAPAIRTFFDSLASRDTARAMISASLSAARAIAAKEQRYAGIRFQTAWHPQGPLYGRQYMIFIVHDFERTGLENGFRAVEGIKPIKLPENLRVMDFTIVTNRDLGTINYSEVRLDDPLLASDQKDRLINDNNSLGFRDTTTFSIIFSPSGKMVIHGVRIKNRDGVPRWPLFLDNSNDDVFNTITRITDPLNPAGMFVQDDYAGDGLGQELSRSGFVIYERDKFQQALNRGLPHSDYLWQVVPQTVYINPYTGRIIR